MTDPTSPSPLPASTGTTDPRGPAADAIPVTPAEPVPAPTRSRTWIGLLVLVVVMALLVGATAALFVRVQQAQDRADEAVVLAGSQNDALDTRLADLDATLASVQASATATGDDVTAVRRQVGELRRCVNAALDAWSQSTRSGQPVSITKC